MAIKVPRFVYLMSRRDRSGPFGIRSKQHVSAFHTNPDKQVEKAHAHTLAQMTAWQGCEPQTEFKIAYSGDKLSGFEEGLE